MKHSLKELTVPLGRDINPRFGVSRSSKSGLTKSSSFNTAEEVDDRLRSTSLVKSSSFDSLFQVSALTAEISVSQIKTEEGKTSLASSESENRSTENIQEAELEEPVLDQDSSNTDMEVAVHPTQHKMAWGEGLGYHSRNRGNHNAMMFDGGFTHHEHDCYSGIAAGNGSTHRHHDNGIDIVDFEVTNSETETTVVLKKILAMSSLRDEENNPTGNNRITRSRSSSGTSSPLLMMPAIEESESEEEEENYYESEDIITTPALPIVPYTLPVPTINLVDEDGTILETILQGRAGEIEEESDELVNDTVHVVGDSFVAVGYTPQTVYDESGPSTAL